MKIIFLIVNSVLAFVVWWKLGSYVKPFWISSVGFFLILNGGISIYKETKVRKGHERERDCSRFLMEFHDLLVYFVMFPCSILLWLQWSGFVALLLSLCVYWYYAGKVIVPADTCETGSEKPSDE